MINLIRLSVISVLCALLLACSESDTQGNDNSKDTYALGELANSFYLERDVYMGPIKRTVEVRLAHKLSPEQLKTVAETIKATATRKTERTFIGYTLGQQQSPGYWATTHYDPDLRVEILER